MATVNFKVQDIKNKIETLVTEAGDAKKDEQLRLFSLAEAYYYFNLIQGKNADEEVSVNDEQVTANCNNTINSELFKIAKRQQTVNELAATKLETLGQKIDEVQAAVNVCKTGDEKSGTLAKNVFDQLDRTWRIKWNSGEFNAAKNAIRGIAESRTTPTQEDYYLAAEPVKKYVQKNINKAKSAVGMTRMACALAFLKQTMSPASFASYCKELNEKRGIPQLINNNPDFPYNMTEPRCIVPDDIGTVEEVYNNTLGRIQQNLNTNTNIDSRDFAKLTALKNLASRNTGFGNQLIVEHEALQAEISKVQNDIRFRDAIQSKHLEELVFMAEQHNLDSIDGYAKALNNEQKELLRQRKALLAKELEEQRKIDKLIDDDIKAKAADERARRIEQQLEMERQREREAQRKAFEELRKKQKPLGDMYKEALPGLKALAKAKPAHEKANAVNEVSAEDLEFFATLIALGDEEKKYMLTEDDLKNHPDLYKKEDVPDLVKMAEFKNYVDNLKNNPYVKELAESIVNNPNTDKTVSKYFDNAKKQNELSKEEQELNAVKKISEELQKAYQKKIAPTIPRPFKEVYEDNVKYDLFNYQQGNMQIKEFTKTIATTLAIREAEAKYGPDRGISKLELDTRVNELMKDKLLEKTSQTMLGLSFQQKVDDALNNNPDDTYHAFGEIVEQAYGKALNDQKIVNNSKHKANNKQKQNGPGVFDDIFNLLDAPESGQKKEEKKEVKKSIKK